MKIALLTTISLLIFALFGFTYHDNKAIDYKVTTIKDFTRDGITDNQITTNSKAGKVIYNNSLYYSGLSNGSTGRSLLKYDGTAVTKISGSGGTEPKDFIVYAGNLYFTGYSGIVDGRVLLKYDGTSVSTVTATASMNPRDLILYNSNLVFSGYGNSSATRDLYTFDGTTVTKVSGSGGSDPQF